MFNQLIINGYEYRNGTIYTTDSQITSEYLISWGAKRFTAIQDGLLFHVQGYLLNGWVKVVYNYGTDAFDVYFFTNKKELIKKVEEAYIDNLVDVIDWYVEKDNSFDYEQRVKEQYSFSLY